MSLLQFLRILYARRAIILAALLGCFLVATVTAFLLPKQYTATTRLLLDVVKPDPLTGEQIGARGLAAFAQTQAQIIKDYRTAGRVVDDLGWTQSPDLAAEYSTKADTANVDFRRWLAERVINSTEASLVPGTQILEISYSANSPEVAKRIVDLVRGAYLEENVRFRRAGAASIADWYDEQAQRALTQLRDAEKKRNDYAAANGIVLDESSTDIETVKLRALSGETAAATMAPSAPSGGGLSAVDQIDAQIAQAALTLGPNHPQMLALKRQRALAAAAPRASAGGVNVAAVESAFQRQKARVLGQSGKIDLIRQMQDEITLRREQYTKAVQRVADFRMESNVGQTGITPLSDGVVSNKPSFPNIPAIIGGSLVVGLGLGLGLALLVELMARRVRSGDDLGEAARAPVFATIGVPRKPGSFAARVVRFLERKKKRQEEGAMAG